MFKPKGPFCQSCGMPLSKDEHGGGTESDGTRTTTYCSHCYREGKFTEPNLTLEKMITKVEGKMRQMHIPSFLTKHFTKDIPTLQRWKH
jgi:hypothetical protein